MSQIIITTDINDFIIYDLNSEATIHRQGITAELDCKQLKDSGRPTFRPFGIAQDEDSIYIASNNRIGKFNKSNYEFDKLIKVPLWINTHQILKDGDTLYTCNSAIDTVGIYKPDQHQQLSLNYMKIYDQQFSPAYANQLDTRHINTIYNHNDDIYFVRHNRGIVASDIGLFDKRTLTPQILISVGKACHGITIVENVLYTLSTETGELIAIELSTLNVQKVKLVDPDSTFLRGLDFVDGNLVIGCSINYKKNTKAKSCFLLVVNLNTSGCKKLELPGIKFINDLQILS